ncbi:MAG TPA: TlyA family RNA methyltransferase [Myxococcota bacterium]|nr:TlyA family RNA methyltransferase [Myxococcota bacterium]
MKRPRSPSPPTSRPPLPAGASPEAPERQHPARKVRLDELVVERALCESRTRAQALILAGRVLVEDVPVEKPGTRVSANAAVRLRGGAGAFVSRGGEKLAGALADLALDPRGLDCLDVGASTGGFTDCLLQHGARRVVAVDVGYGQLHLKLRGDPRVRVLERTHARELTREALGGPVQLVTVDASFISLRILLPPLRALAPEAEFLVLVKPQFEAGKGRVGKGGVVRDNAQRAEAVAAVRLCAEGLGLEAVGQAESRLAGPKGNREVFVRFRPHAGPG